MFPTICGRRACTALAAAALFLGLLASAAHAESQPRPIRVLEVRGVISSSVAQYLERNLARSDARLCVVLLDTPGGSYLSTRRAVEAILGSQVPVVVFVTPQGAQAASAGMFITLAGNVAAMAPGTNIGAAHPVGPAGEDIEGHLGAKVTNDAAALARSIAETRGRNVTWAEQAVRASLSLSAQEAVQQKVVDLVAVDLDDLLRQLEGRRLSTAAGEVVLALQGAPQERVWMTLFEQLLHALVDPNIAYALMVIGILAIMVELWQPGVGVSGVLGTICLILAFIAFESLPLNWGGVALIVLAVFLFALDTRVPGFALSVGGAIAFILGSLILFSPLVPASPTMPVLRVSPWLIATMTGLLVALFAVVLITSIRGRPVAVSLGIKAVLGARGVAVTPLAPQGIVQAQGEQWTAVAEGAPIAAGEPVEVVGVEGNQITVRRPEA